jgi:hypothetical protein
LTIDLRETRASQRFEAKLPVTVDLADRQFSCETGNVSLGGAYLLTAERFPLGTKLSLRIVLPKVKDAIEVGATVRWSADTGIGVQFDGLRARDVWALGKFLA